MVRKQGICWLLIAFALNLSGCGEFAPQAGKKKKKTETTTEKLKPAEENTFQELMKKSAYNINYIVYGLLNYDEVKVKRGTQSLIRICRLMMKKLPDDVMGDAEEKEKWEAIYREQNEIAENLNYRFEEAKYDESREELKNLMKNCMSCHKEITGIAKAELTFIGKRNPSMEMSLTQVMDANNLNFDDVLFGLIAHDLDELEGALNNMKRASALMMAKIPSQYESQKEKWDTYCKSQREIGAKLGESVKADQTDAIWDNVQELLKACMDCHKLYKPGIK